MTVLVVLVFPCRELKRSSAVSPVCILVNDVDVPVSGFYHCTCHSLPVEPSRISAAIVRGDMWSRGDVTIRYVNRYHPGIRPTTMADGANAIKEVVELRTWGTSQSGVCYNRCLW